MNKLLLVKPTRRLLALFIAAACTLLAPNSVLAISCSGNQLVDVTLPTGARWEMCWAVRDKEGVVLSEVAYETPSGPLRNVLKEASLAGVNLAFDDGTQSERHVSDTANGGGLGLNIQALISSDCTNGTFRQHSGNNVLCVRSVPRNYAYKSYGNVKQGYALEVESRSTIGLSSYIIRWRFYDDGSIEPKIGLAGGLPLIGSDATRGWALDNNNRIGVAFNTSYFFRLDFDLAADGSNEIVEEFEVTPSANRLSKSLSVSALNTEASRSVSPDLKRSWRIRDNGASAVNNADGRPISYHIEPLHTAHEYTGSSTESWAQSDIHFTRFDSCEQLIVDNPTTGGCGASITDFVNGQSIQDEDIVIWYKMNYHHVPRSEDEPAVQIHWDSFIIVPRDWTATNPLVIHFPVERTLKLLAATGALS